MGALNITDEAIQAEAQRRGIAPGEMTARMASAIRRDLAQQQIDARNPNPAADAAPAGHVVVTVEATYEGRVLGVSQYVVPVPVAATNTNP